MTVTEQ